MSYYVIQLNPTIKQETNHW